jgi:phage/plasmid primase-like uncharacterized protein/phage/plasmid-associated DNA primase
MHTLSQFMAEKGFFFPESFDGQYLRDGSKWYRGVEVAVNGRKLFVARFGDWKTDQVFDWQSDAPSDPAEQEAISRALEQFRKAESEEKRRIQEEVAIQAAAKWGGAITRGTTPYLQRKGIPSLLGARIDQERTDRLLVPARDIHGKLWGYQRILAEKIQVGGDFVDKFFLKGMRIEGCFHTIGDLPDESEPEVTLLVAEGFATGASLHLATGFPVVCAFNAGNLLAVAEALRFKYPQAIILICGDEDLWTRVKDEPRNPGREKASAAAHAVGGIAVFPRFRDLSTRPTDFNDLHLLEGLDAVKVQIEAALSGEAEPTSPDEAASLKEGPGAEHDGAGASSDMPANQGPLSPLPWKESKKGGKPTPPDHQKVADRLLEHYGDTLIKQGSDLFRFVGTHWQILEEKDTDALFRQLQFLYSGKATASQLESMMKLFRLGVPSAPVDMFAPRPEFANFTDGTLVLSRGPDYKWRKEFRAHRRADYLLNCIPLSYQKAQGAKNPAFLDTLERVFAGDADKDQKIHAIRQMYGACLAPIKPHLFLLHGPAGSGKTSLIIPAMRLVSEENRCSVQPHEFKGFLMETMVGKLVNFRTDIKVNEPIDDDTIKMIEDRVPIRIDRKFKTAIYAPLPAIHIMGANAIPPTLEGASGAHTRRWTFLRLSAHKTELGKYMHDYGNWVFDQEPHGVLAFALEGLDDLLETDHYVVPESGLTAITEWQRMHDPIGQFLHECSTGEVVDNNTQVRVGSTWRIEKPRLWVIFSDWSKNVSGKSPVLTRYKFYSSLRGRGYSTIKGKLHEEWVGIGTKEVESSDF